MLSNIFYAREIQSQKANFRKQSAKEMLVPKRDEVSREFKLLHIPKLINSHRLPWAVAQVGEA
jgi:hypothetical protein